MENLYMIILRLIHIFSGVFWAGALMYGAFFVMPAAKAAGPEGKKFLQHLSMGKMPIAMMISALLTILSGFLMYWKLSDGFKISMGDSPFLMTLAIGATAAIIGFAYGFSVNKPTAAKMAKLGGEIAKAGGPPNAEQAAQLAMLSTKLEKATKVVLVLLMIALLAMATARYM